MGIDKFKHKNIHIIGVSGSEGGSIFNFLISHKIYTLTCHDFIAPDNLEKNFKTWHKGLSLYEREKLWKSFSLNLRKCTVHLGKDYLQNINKADIVFLPQSWRLYKENKILEYLFRSQKIIFYNLTKLYLEYAKAKIVGVTGTVGKGSTAYLLVQLLKQSLSPGKNIYFAGNETWMPQVTEQLDKMTRNDILVLEISHRQLLDGLNRSPNMVIFTNLYPNHLDELSYEEYKKIKLSLLKKQTKKDIAVVNFDNPDLRSQLDNINSNIYYYSEKNQKMNTKNIQKIYKNVMNNNSIHYPENILAAATAANILGVSISSIKKNLPSLQSLTARMEYIGTNRGIRFYDDIKSTTPWATIRALEKLGKNTILICGGDTKGINYDNFIKRLGTMTKYVISLPSDLSNLINTKLTNKSYSQVANLDQAIKLAQKLGDKGDNILVSPAAAFFYTKFIAQKISFKKLFTFLPQGEKS